MVYLHSDDYGRDKKVDQKILTLAKKGKISEISVLSNLASDQSLKKLADLQKKMRTLKVGLHINFVENAPLSSRKQLFSTLLFVTKLFVNRFKKRDLKNEVESQLKRLKEFKIRVNSLDSHIHTHAISPIADIVEEIAKKYRIKNVRSYSSVGTFTLKGKINYEILRVVSLFSNLIFNGKFDLPASWKENGSKKYGIMTWEGKDFDIFEYYQNGGKASFVIHPFQKTDSNISYYKLIA